MRTLLVIDVPFYRQGLEALLRTSSGIEVIDRIATTMDAPVIAAHEHPDLVLLDIGADQARTTVRCLRELMPAPKIVALALDETPECILEWAEAGISGYVPRQATLADLLEVLRGVHRGETHCSPRVMSMVFHRLATLSSRYEPRTRMIDLTTREREIVHLLASGVSNKVIAARLGISHATAKNHVHHILDKLQLRSRGEVAPLIRTESRQDRTSVDH